MQLSCAAPLTWTEGAPGAPLQPLIVGWEQFFTLDWQVEEQGDGAVIHGHITNEWGMPATSIQLLIEGLDAGGELVTQSVHWLGTRLTPGMRAYFEYRLPESAPAYRVRVFAFDWIQFGTGGDRR